MELCINEDLMCVAGSDAMINQYLTREKMRREKKKKVSVFLFSKWGKLVAK